MLISSIAHDFKTPLNSIQSTNYLIEQIINRKELGDDIRQMIKVNSSSCRFLMQLIQDVTDLGRLEFNQFEIKNSEFSLNDAVKEVFDILYPLSDMKNLQIEFDFGISRDIVIFGDETRFQQILFNLVSNSIKYTMKGKIRVKIANMNHINWRLDELEKENVHCFLSSHRMC